MDLASALGGFVAGLVSGYTIKIAIDVRGNKQHVSTSVKNADGSTIQSGNVAGGHIAGGNIHSTKE